MRMMREVDRWRGARPKESSVTVLKAKEEWVMWVSEVIIEMEELCPTFSVCVNVILRGVEVEPSLKCAGANFGAIRLLIWAIIGKISIDQEYGSWADAWRHVSHETGNWLHWIDRPPTCGYILNAFRRWTCYLLAQKYPFSFRRRAKVSHEHQVSH